MTPCPGNVILFCSSQQVPCLRLGPLKGSLDWHKVLQGPTTHLLHCFWNYRERKDTVSYAALGKEVPAHFQEHLMQTLTMHQNPIITLLDLPTYVV